MADPYVLPSGALRNKLGITNSDKLSAAESNLTGLRLRFIDTKGPQGPFSFDRLKETHRYIFQDVYDWAGKVRETELSKDGHKFEARALIEARGHDLMNGLSRANELRGLTRETFAEKAADLMGAINQLHPFREGNGRTQRAFLEGLAEQAGHSLAFHVVSRERMIQASIESSAGRPEMLRRLFAEISDPSRVTQLAKAAGFLDRQGFDWNDRYVATTTPGQSYSGQLVGRAGGDFMMRTKTEIFIGRSADIPKDAAAGDAISFTAGGAPRNAAQQKQPEAPPPQPSPAGTPATPDKAAQYAELEARLRRADQAEGRRRNLDKARGRDGGGKER